MAFGVTWNAKRDKIVRLVFATLFVWDDVVNDHPCLNIIAMYAAILTAITIALHHAGPYTKPLWTISVHADL